MILLFPLLLILFVLLLILKLAGGPITWLIVWLPLLILVAMAVVWIILLSKPH